MVGSKHDVEENSLIDIGGNVVKVPFFNMIFKLVRWERLLDLKFLFTIFSHLGVESHAFFHDALGNIGNLDLGISFHIGVTHIVHEAFNESGGILDVFGIDFDSLVVLALNLDQFSSVDHFPCVFFSFKNKL